MSKTKKNGRGSATRGWKKEQPGYHQRTVMLKKCGKKCFLGPGKTFPICKKNTCKISKKGVYAAYIRARQYKHNKISKKAKKMLKKC
jgi:hypothetical protein